MMPDTPSDICAREILLMQLVAQGNQEAFTELYDEHATLVHSVSLRILADPEEAADITQTVFLTLYRKPSAWNPRQGRLAAWLAVAARNHSISRLRRLKVSNRFRESLYEEAAADGAEISLPALDPLEADLLKQALDELPEAQRRALEMAFFGSLTHDQISGALAEPLGTVKARIRRGLLKLRERCGQLGIERPGFATGSA